MKCSTFSVFKYILVDDTYLLVCLKKTEFHTLKTIKGFFGMLNIDCLLVFSTRIVRQHWTFNRLNEWVIKWMNYNAIIINQNKQLVADNDTCIYIECLKVFVVLSLVVFSSLLKHSPSEYVVKTNLEFLTELNFNINIKNHSGTVPSTVLFNDNQSFEQTSLKKCQR